MNIYFDRIRSYNTQKKTFLFFLRTVVQYLDRDIYVIEAYKQMLRMRISFTTCISISMPTLLQHNTFFFILRAGQVQIHSWILAVVVNCIFMRRKKHIMIDKYSPVIKASIFRNKAVESENPWICRIYKIFKLV